MANYILKNEQKREKKHNLAERGLQKYLQFNYELKQEIDLLKNV